MTGRELAYSALIEFDSSTDQISTILDNLLAAHSVNPRDKKFLFNLVNGVLRHRSWLDWQASNYYRGKYAQTQVELKNILRPAFYEIHYLDYIPPHATVNEYVSLCRQKISAKAAALVNAVLRNSLRDKNPPQPFQKFKYPATQLAVQYSYPEWMISRWMELWGESRTEKLCHAMNQRPDFDLHINPAKTDPEIFARRLTDLGIFYKKSEYSDLIFKIFDIQQLLKHNLLSDGTCRIQDESGILPVDLLAPKMHTNILDACVAPGSKYIALHEYTQYTSLVVGSELFSDRLKRTRQNCLTWPVKEYALVIADASIPPFKRVFDNILLDAPCSGLGTIAKNPDIKWRRSQAQIAEFTNLQWRLLSSVSQLLKPGGSLVYSTCTIDPDENEQIIKKFIDHSRGTYRLLQPAGGKLQPFTDDNYIKTFPDIHEMEGSFAAKLEYCPQ